jgi:hypothetical protein
MDRRAFLGLTVAVPAVVVAERHYKKKQPLNYCPKVTQGPDPHFASWDDGDTWEFLNKDEMHL